MRQLFELAQHVEDDAADPLHAGRALLLDHGLAPTRDALKPPMVLSAAIEKACEEASPDVAKKVRVVGDLALAFYGDIPMTSLELASSFDFLHMVWMLPKGRGKAHGRNRHGQAGRDLCPLAETKEADRKDAALVADILAQEDLSVPEKRRRLVTELTPRLVDSYLIVQRDHFNRIVRAALGAKRVGRDIDDEDRIVPSHSQLKRRMQKWHNAQKTDCGLPTRVSHPKRRRSWSLEHIARLLNSPVYTGTSSKVQRWRPAKASKRHVIRDALYWVPLFMICLGVRPEEILQLKIRNVRRRDGVICLFLGDDADERLKTGESRRILPVPQLLLDLGSREWAIQRHRSDEIWAFPEVAPSEADGRRSQIFGDRMRTLLGRLKLKFSDEDIYAMRRTLSSKLLHLKVDRGVRQRILGHLEGTTIDRHYSDDGLQDLKEPRSGAATALDFLTASELDDELAAAGILRFEMS